MAARIILRIELVPNSKARLNDLQDKLGMTQVAMLSRLIEWFADQNNMIQAAIMGHYPVALKSDIVRIILKRMDKEEAEEKKAKLAE